MPIQSVHPAYAANIERWKRCRAAYEGEDAVKAAQTEYLPRLSGQQGDEYAAYVKRALYYEAVGRSIDGFVGAIVRKAPVFKLPATIADDFEKDITASGIGLTEFIKKLCAESLLIGRLGILVDYDEEHKRTYLAAYNAESITNWGDDFVVLKETVYLPDPSDPFVQKAIDQYRELRIEDGKFVVNIWRKKETTAAGATDEFEVFETITPKRLGQTIAELPFYWLSCYGKTSKIDKPPLLGLVNVAFSHYRSSADLEHGRHFTGLPTLYVSGMRDNGSPIKVGSMAAIVLEDPAAKAAYAEFSGQGLGSLERALEEKEHMMAVLGAAVFADNRKGVEAAETARIRTSGETSLLMGVVNSVEETLDAAVSCAAGWMNVAGEIDIGINRDFIDTALDAQTLAALLDSYLKGAISHDTFLYNLKQAEMIDPAKSIDEEKTAISSAPVAGAEVTVAD